MRRVDIESLKDGGPVKPEAEVGSLVADREDHCAGKGIMLVPIIVICCLASCCKMVYGKVARLTTRGSGKGNLGYVGRRHIPRSKIL